MRGDRLARRRDRAPQDGGFTLIEVVVALALLSLVMTASAALFMRTMGSSNKFDQRQVATTVASQAMELVRSVPPVGGIIDVTQANPAGLSLMVAGRTQTLVNAQWAAAPSTVDLTQMDKAYDPSSSPPSPTVPLSSSTVVGGKTYSVVTYIGTCQRVSSGACQTHAVAGSTGTVLFRVIVAVSWNPGAGQTCSGGCQYVLSTLIDPSGDPTFNTNASAAPTLPPAPVAADDTATVQSPSSVAVNVVGNDTGNTVDPTTVTVTGGPSHGTATPDSTGRVTYTPAGYWTGQDTFTYTVKDTSGQTSNNATVTVTVTAPPGPSAVNDSASVYVGSSVAIPVLTNDSGNPINSGSVTVTQSPARGSVSVSGSGVVTYTPSGSSAGTDTFRYTVKDSYGQTSNTATVSVTIGQAPPPLAVNDTDSVRNSSRRTHTTTISVLDNDSGYLTGATVSIVSPPSIGSATVSGTDIIFTAPTSRGTATFTYRVTDVLGRSSTATVTVTVT